MKSIIIYKPMTDQELKDLVASLAVDSKNLHAAQMETREQMKRNDKMLTDKLNRKYLFWRYRKEWA